MFTCSEGEKRVGGIRENCSVYEVRFWGCSVRVCVFIFVCALIGVDLMARMIYSLDSQFGPQPEGSAFDS